MKNFLLRIAGGLLVLMVIVIATGCARMKDEVAVLDTDKGEIVIGFFPDAAPNHVANFKKLAKEGVYNGVLFHRVIPGFVIQTGDPKTADPNTPRSEYGTGGTGNHIGLEVNEHHHVRGAVGMARGPDPNSADSQFYITLEPQPHLDRGYTVFGEVLKGMEVADSIAAVPTEVHNVPIEPVHLNSVKIESRKEAGLK